jgi:hypothetical protein
MCVGLTETVEIAELVRAGKAAAPVEFVSSVVPAEEAPPPSSLHHQKRNPDVAEIFVHSAPVRRDFEIGPSTMLL